MKILNFRALFFAVVTFCIALVFAKEITNVNVLYIIFAILGFLTLFFVCKKFKCIKRFVFICLVFIFGVLYFMLSYSVQVGYQATSGAFCRSLSEGAHTPILIHKTNHLV